MSTTLFQFWQIRLCDSGDSSMFKQSVITRMLSSVFEQVKIFGSVIRFDFIDVMNNFFSIKQSSKDLFCFKNMFGDIALIISRVFCFSDENVSATACSSAHTFNLFPVGVLPCLFHGFRHAFLLFRRSWGKLSSNIAFPCAFQAAIFSIITFMDCKNLFADATNNVFSFPMTDSSTCGGTKTNNFTQPSANVFPTYFTSPFMLFLGKFQLARSGAKHLISFVQRFFSANWTDFHALIISQITSSIKIRLA